MLAICKDKPLNENIIAIRKYRKLTAAQTAKEARMLYETYREIEDGDVFPNTEQLLEITRKLGVSMTHLLSYPEPIVPVVKELEKDYVARLKNRQDCTETLQHIQEHTILVLADTNGHQSGRDKERHVVPDGQEPAAPVPAHQNLTYSKAPSVSEDEQARRDQCMAKLSELNAAGLSEAMHLLELLTEVPSYRI